MAKGKKKDAGEQLDLIDVKPKNAKEIMAAAEVYDKHKKARLKSLQNEVAHKAIVLALVKEAELQPMADGIIRFELNGTVFSVEPRDEVIRITKAKDAKE